MGVSYFCKNYMKNFKLLFLFLVILFVSTEAAPKGGRGGGGRGRGGGRRGGGYGGGGGGDGDFGELPTWLIILIFVLATIFLTSCIMCCINYCEDEDDKDNSNLQRIHENRVPNEYDQRDQYWLHPTAPSLEPQVNSAQISNSSHLPYALNPIQTSQSSNLYSDQPYF